MPNFRALAFGLGRGVRRAAPALIALTVVAAIGGGGYAGYRWLMSSDRFAVAEIEIRGEHRLDRDHVLEIGGIAVGQNIFRLDLDQVERALERDPWIAEATVQRQLPGRLVVILEENRAASLVELGGLYLADARGTVFKRASIQSGDAEGLPLITGIERTQYLEENEGARRLIRRGVRIHRLYHRRSDRPALGEIHLDEHQGITLVTLDHAISIRLGHVTDEMMNDRLRAFDATWASLSDSERSAARVIHADARTTDRVTVAFASRRDEPGAN